MCALLPADGNGCGALDRTAAARRPEGADSGGGASAARASGGPDACSPAASAPRGAAGDCCPQRCGSRTLRRSRQPPCWGVRGAAAPRWHSCKRYGLRHQRQLGLPRVPRQRGRHSANFGPGSAARSALAVVAMLDVRGAQWCRGALPAARCALFRCPCPYAAVTNLSAAGYTQCLLGVYICKLRIKLAILERGFHVFFIDADAAPRRNVLQYLPPPPVAAVGACEHCSGTCELRPSVARLIDHPQVGPVALGNYWQLNIGFIWLNHTDPAPALALRESIAAIVSHRLDFKSVDQTVFNRRLIARRAATRCLPPAVGGLNIRGRGSRPKQWPDAWGVHAARLVSRDAFYKQALLWHNGLWRRNASAEFVDLVRRWQQKPKSLKRHLEQLGRL
eukprot:TRINITY_DN26800_c0_g1_i3.p1 TRINITY_DN26800_c0_g1~~TRINITY_DN26800_c0_g1_i3.p1  ORF type:complete len:445 (+),score=47.95 TRINITY_DN26800_c0_g1_i3:162-1337(+)